MTLNTGYLYDTTGTYDATFFVGGASIIVAGLLLLWVPVWRYVRRQRLLRWQLSAMDIEKVFSNGKDVENYSSVASSSKQNNEDVHATACTSLLVPEEEGKNKIENAENGQESRSLGIEESSV